MNKENVLNHSKDEFSSSHKKLSYILFAAMLNVYVSKYNLILTSSRAFFYLLALNRQYQHFFFLLFVP